jgi:hypothetical protein
MPIFAENVFKKTKNLRANSAELYEKGPSISNQNKEQ